MSKKKIKDLTQADIDKECEKHTVNDCCFCPFFPFGDCNEILKQKRFQDMEVEIDE